MTEEVEGCDDFFMGLIFWLLMGLVHITFIYNFAQELTFYQIEKTNQQIVEEWNSHDSTR